MIELDLKVHRINAAATLPSKAHPADAGWDVATIDGFTLWPRHCMTAHTGLSLSVPEGYEVQIRPRSGLAAKYGITVLNAPATIDAGYQGEILVLLVNHGNDARKFVPGDRIAQLVPQRVLETRVSWAEAEVPAELTDRGVQGFGSSG